MGTKRDRNAAATQESRYMAAEAATEYASGPESSGLDELDEAILHHLERHGRATNYEVGEAVGLSASAASRRIQVLEATGAIRGYRAQIDDRLLGKRMTVFIRVTLERQSAPVLAAFETAVRKSKAGSIRMSCHACPELRASKPASPSETFWR
jgi:DNA-binding Lrp family transcriptional regulator